MDKLIVVKIGGNIIDDEKKLNIFLSQFAAINSKKILIHGGGKIATTLAQKLGINQKIIDGRRVTDEETLKLITMVYGGGINKKIVAKLQYLRCNSIGFCGADGKLILSKKRNDPKIDFGFVGDIVNVNSEAINNFLNFDYTPIFAPITIDENGQLLNTNADSVASEIAISMCKYFDVQLIFGFEKNGVLIDLEKNETVIPKINFSDYEVLKKENKISDGMLPKLENSFSAIKQGVKKIIIGNAEMLSDLINNNSGTIIYNE